ncbi:hypothetical protein SLIQ_21975 [Serratia liquefaciens FK01]|nr:hypothetical protein SLIQ_21975 [Serratia liquefaciens FK01]
MNWTPTILKNDVFRSGLRTQVLNKRGGMIYTPFSIAGMTKRKEPWNVLSGILNNEQITFHRTGPVESAGR